MENCSKLRSALLANMICAYSVLEFPLWLLSFRCACGLVFVGFVLVCLAKSNFA